MLLIGTPEPGFSVTPPAFYAEIAKEFALPYEAAVIGEVLRDASLKADPIHPNARGYGVIAAARRRAAQERAERSEPLEVLGTVDVPQGAQRAPARSRQALHGLVEDLRLAPGTAIENRARRGARRDQRIAAVFRRQQHDPYPAQQSARRAPQVARPSSAGQSVPIRIARRWRRSARYMRSPEVVPLSAANDAPRESGTPHARARDVQLHRPATLRRARCAARAA